MKTIFFVLVNLFSFSALSLSGTWRFTEVIYKGARQPLPNPALRLRWTFFENGTDRLYWDHLDSPGFCERFASYLVKDGVLEEEVFAVNPGNAPECSKDSDMQLGRKTKSPMELLANEILIHANLGDDELVYVLTPEI